MLKSREKYHPQHFSAAVGNFYKGREQSRALIDVEYVFFADARDPRSVPGSEKRDENQLKNISYLEMDSAPFSTSFTSL